MRSRTSTRARALLGVTALVAALGGVALGGSSSAAATPKGVCDIYAAGGTPCQAAHSTTRALYAGYDGPLYQVRRSSDGASKDIGVTATGGLAASGDQDAFCAGTDCVISVVYDQTSNHNDLTQAPPGGFSGPAAGGYDNLADATAAPIEVQGHRAYGVFVAPGTGYRDNTTKGIATGDDPEGMYAVLDGTHYNDGCCFDYGNAETDSLDDGNGTMEAIYFGNNTFWGSGPGNGPWIMADLENGLFSGLHSRYNANDLPMDHRFTTAMVKGGHDLWAIRGGDSQRGRLDTLYNGARPNEAEGYDPMKKQGAIVLGIGGDNSVSGAGTFYEGVMTSGYPTPATEDRVQANIVAAKYTAAPIALDPGPQVSVSSASAPKSYVTNHPSDQSVVVAPTGQGSAGRANKKAATFVETAGLADPACVSFESVYQPGTYLRHRFFQLHQQRDDGSALFDQDATFCPRAGNSGTGTSFESTNFQGKFLRSYHGVVYLSDDSGSNAWDDPANFADDTTFVVRAPLAPTS